MATLVDHGDLAGAWGKSPDEAIGIEQKLSSISLMKSGRGKRFSSALLYGQPPVAIILIALWVYANLLGSYYR